MVNNMETTKTSKNAQFSMTADEASDLLTQLTWGARNKFKANSRVQSSWDANIAEIACEARILIFELIAKNGRPDQMNEAFLGLWLQEAAEQLLFVAKNTGVAACVGMTTCPNCGRIIEWSEAVWEVREEKVEGAKKRTWRALEEGQEIELGQHRRAFCPVDGCHGRLVTSKYSFVPKFADLQVTDEDGEVIHDNIPYVISAHDSNYMFAGDRPDNMEREMEARIEEFALQGAVNLGNDYIKTWYADVIQGSMAQGACAKKLGITDAKLSRMVIIWTEQATMLTTGKRLEQSDRQANINNRKVETGDLFGLLF
jgi:hypothetical protein